MDSQSAVWEAGRDRVREDRAELYATSNQHICVQHQLYTLMPSARFSSWLVHYKLDFGLIEVKSKQKAIIYVLIILCSQLPVVALSRWWFSQRTLRDQPSSTETWSSQAYEFSINVRGRGIEEVKGVGDRGEGKLHRTVHNKAITQTVSNRNFSPLCPRLLFQTRSSLGASQTGLWAHEG